MVTLKFSTAERRDDSLVVSMIATEGPYEMRTMNRLYPIVFLFMFSEQGESRGLPPHIENVPCLRWFTSRINEHRMLFA